LRIKEQETCLTLHEHDDEEENQRRHCLKSNVHNLESGGL